MLNRESLNTFWTVVAVTALLGWLPVLITFGLAQLAMAQGGREWDSITSGFFFALIYFALFGAGAWICARYLNR